MLWLAGLVACSDPSPNVRVRAELVRLPGQSAGAVAVAGPGTSATTVIHPWTSQVSISSLLVPIVAIELVNAAGTGPFVSLYQCPGFGAACRIELNGPALQTLLSTAPVTVAPNTFDLIRVDQCDVGKSSFSMQMSATTSLGGASYHSNRASNLSTTGPEELVDLDGFGCGNRYPINPPIVVADTTDLTILLRLYFDITDLAYAALGVTTSSPGHVTIGCTPTPSGVPSPILCAATPTIAAVEGTTPPVSERYRVNGGATVSILFDPRADTFVGGFFRAYYVEDVIADPGFGPFSYFEEFVPNGDGTYRLTQHGVSGTPNAADFPRFQRASHSGTATSWGIPFSYSAVRLP